MNKQEAEEKLEDMRIENTEKTCPLSSGFCRESCVCFMQRVVMNSILDGVEHWAADSGCKNKMFFGD